MAAEDGFYIGSTVLDPAIAAGGDYVFATLIDPSTADAGLGLLINVSSALAAESGLISVSPDPALYGQALVVTGINLHLVQRIVVDGVSASFTIISSTQINVTLPLMAAGVKSIYAEYV